MYNPYDSGRDVGNLLASQLLTEQSQPLRERRIVAIYSGRFQPFHRGHYSVYEHLVERFGADNVYVGTSNATDSKKSPFSYGEKYEIITRMFGIPENKIHQVRLPYKPIEILNKLPEGIAFVTAISEKDDSGRFAGKYYERFPDDVSELKEYRERGYFVEVPVGGNNISGTEIREVLGNPATDLKAKKEFFREIYGRFDSKIFELIVNRLSPLQESILLEGVNDPGILKAVILAGGPGSGKGYVSRELFGIPKGASYAPSGMKVLNSDRVLEHLLKKEGLPLDLNTLQKTDPEAFRRVTDNDDPNSLMNVARRVNASLWKRYTDERLGIIIDGTGANIDKARIQLAQLRKQGYDVKMTFVQTPLDVAQKRNLQRERKLSSEIVERLWNQTNENLKEFKKMFGEENVQVINNVGKSVTKEIQKVADAHINNSVQNPVGQKWVADEKRKIVAQGKAKGKEKLAPQAPSGQRKKAPKGRVKNPRTGNSILVKTALGYEKGHPARKAAVAAMEAITIPVEVGDTILTGKFKNKKTVVKDIGTDDHGMPTVNGRKAATFRTTKDETSEGDDGKMISRVAVNEYRNRVARKKLISEGGAAGHMDHPFEDMSLTFGDLKQLVSLGLEGKLNVEAPVTEKLDGQNIFVSYCDGRVVFARNKSHMKGRGTDALDVAGIRQMFEGRGEVSEAFTLAAQDLDRAIRSLSPRQVNDVFDGGSKWANLEIIYPATQNVIPYGLNMLVFHNTIEVDDNGDVVGVDGDAQKLVEMIKKINQGVQNTFSFEGPVIVSLPRSKNFSRRKGHYTRRIINLQRQHNLRDNDKVIMWHQCWWENFIDSRAAKYKYRMPNNVRHGLLRRWAFQEPGSYPIATMKKEIVTQNTVKDIRAQKFLNWALSYDKGGKAEQFKTNIAPFEKIFLELGAEILTNVKDLLTVSPGEAAESMRNDLDSTIKELRKTTDVKKMAQVKQQLANLDSMGDCIVPTEGIVFLFKNKLFKFTGTFAPMNQLMSLNLG